jgi:hypothetical protein
MDVISGNSTMPSELPLRLQGFVFHDHRLLFISNTVMLVMHFMPIELRVFLRGRLTIVGEGNGRASVEWTPRQQARRSDIKSK